MLNYGNNSVALNIEIAEKSVFKATYTYEVCIYFGITQN